MTRTIAISLKKGGVGKTTTAVNLSAELSKRGKKVLLVDIDPQANATTSCGIDVDSLNYSIRDLFEDIKLDPKDVIVKTTFNLDVLPSHPSLLNTQNTMTAANVGELKAFLKPIESAYDFVIVDTAPSETKLELAALVYVNDVIIPVETQFLSLQGLKQTRETIENIQATLNPHLNILGILLAKVHSRTNMGAETSKLLREKFGKLVFPFSVDFTIRHPEASMHGKPLVILDPKHYGSSAYHELADFLLK